MSTLPIFATGEQVEASPSSTYRWATVTDTDPLRVRLDGDIEGLPLTPDTLVASTDLAVGARVWVQFYGRRLIVLGKGGGENPPIETVRLTDVAETQFAYTSASWTFASSVANDTPTIVADGRTVTLSARIRTTVTLSAATDYWSFYIPDRFAPVGHFRVQLAVFTNNGSNSVGPSMEGHVEIDTSTQRPWVHLMSASGSATWTAGTWIYLGGTWIRNYPIPPTP